MICHFSAGNRLMWYEPHYTLPLLSKLQRSLAHIFIRLAGKSSHYHEKHLSYWGLKTLVKYSTCTDHTVGLVNEPGKYFTDYMVPPGS